MNHERATILALAIDVPIGTDVAGVLCPYCGGGGSRERSLSISRRRDCVLYTCHRASCGVGGRISSVSQVIPSPDPVKPKEPKLYTGSFQDVPKSVIHQYIAKYPGFTAETLNRACRWSPEYQRTVWPVRSAAGAVRGYELRSIDNKGGPKTLSFRYTPGVFQGYVWTSEPGRTVVLVEDIISASRAANAGYYCVSLMGSHVSLDNLTDLPDNIRKVVLCLDRDATDKAIGYTAKYGVFFDIEMRRLDQDLKYLTNNQIREVVDGRT